MTPKKQALKIVDEHECYGRASIGRLPERERLVTAISSALESRERALAKKRVEAVNSCLETAESKVGRLTAEFAAKDAQLVHAKSQYAELAEVRDGQYKGRDAEIHQVAEPQGEALQSCPDCARVYVESERDRHGKGKCYPAIEVAPHCSDAAPEGCELVAHHTGEGWVLTVENEDRETVAYLKWPASWPETMSAGQLAAKGFIIL